MSDFNKIMRDHNRLMRDVNKSIANTPRIINDTNRVIRNTDWAVRQGDKLLQEAKANNYWKDQPKIETSLPGYSIPTQSPSASYSAPSLPASDYEALGGCLGLILAPFVFWGILQTYEIMSWNIGVVFILACVYSLSIPLIGSFVGQRDFSGAAKVSILPTPFVSFGLFYFLYEIVGWNFFIAFPIAIITFLVSFAIVPALVDDYSQKQEQRSFTKKRLSKTKLKKESHQSLNMSENMKIAIVFGIFIITASGGAIFLAIIS